MQPQVQPQPTNGAAAATNLAMQQAKQPQNPAQPQQGQQPQQPDGGQQFQSDPAIAQNLESHLSQLPPKQKMFLAGAIQHYPNIIIPALGIVCGQEVFEYFVNLYKTHFANKQNGQPQQQPAQQNTPNPATAGSGQPNSAPPQMQAPNQGQQQPMQQTPQQQQQMPQQSPQQ